MKNRKHFLLCVVALAILLTYLPFRLTSLVLLESDDVTFHSQREAAAREALRASLPESYRACRSLHNNMENTTTVKELRRAGNRLLRDWWEEALTTVINKIGAQQVKEHETTEPSNWNATRVRREVELLFHTAVLDHHRLFGGRVTSRVIPFSRRLLRVLNLRDLTNFTKAVVFDTMSLVAARLVEVAPVEREEVASMPQDVEFIQYWPGMANPFLADDPVDGQSSFLLQKALSSNPSLGSLVMGDASVNRSKYVDRLLFSQLPCVRSAMHSFTQHVRYAVFQWLQLVSEVNGGSGTLVVACGGEGLVDEAERGNSWRRGLFPQRLVMESARRYLHNFTIMYLLHGDDDIFAASPPSKHDILHELFDVFPNFFFLHASPRVNEQGNVPARMVPLPHCPSDPESVEAMLVDHRTQKQRIPTFLQRQRQIVWRGATTGRDPRGFRFTDRAQMVERFLQYGTTHPNEKEHLNVSFSGLCQKVTAEQIPGTLAKGLSKRTLSHYQVHLEVDGNTNSWEGLRWRLLTGMMVVKIRSTRRFIQWYYPLLKHGRELLHVDLDEAVNASLSLLRQQSDGDRISRAAQEFGASHLTFERMDRAVEDAVRNVWRIGYDTQKSWFIRD